MKRAFFFFILGLICIGCERKSPTFSPWQEIAGRDQGRGVIIRYPVYRARVPTHWKRVDPQPDLSNADTTLPLVEFWVNDQISVNIHNFPDQKIPPEAQIKRWGRQLAGITPKETTVTPFSRAGYGGLYFEGVGTLKGNEAMVLGWSFQLDEGHCRALVQGETAENTAFIRQMRADVTIKVVGPPDAVMLYREELIAFANSFELIQELPSEDGI